MFFLCILPHVPYKLIFYLLVKMHFWHGISRQNCLWETAKFITCLSRSKQQVLPRSHGDKPCSAVCPRLEGPIRAFLSDYCKVLWEHGWHFELSLVWKSTSVIQSFWWYGLCMGIRDNTLKILRIEEATTPLSSDIHILMGSSCWWVNDCMLTVKGVLNSGKLWPGVGWAPQGCRYRKRPEAQRDGN